MHIHILGICGTFMGSLAVLAKELGYQVSGSDQNVYPPMSTQLEEQGITLCQGYDPQHLEPAPDMVIIGNTCSRGNPAVEYVLDRGLPFTSGPQWLAQHVLQGRWVLAVAGTHGKTTTTTMLTWILDQAGLNPGYLIGGVPLDFGCSARLGNSPFFVIEADEYDSAFFDKRSKFIHYLPRTLIMGNLEFDHADIFSDLAAIQTQFHHLLKTVPGNGLVLSPAANKNLQEVLDRGLWSSLQHFDVSDDPSVEWRLKPLREDGSHFEIHWRDQLATVSWGLLGQHNMQNGLAAVAASVHAGVSLQQACDALNKFTGVKRRLELLADINGVKIFDDFAHHPTAIKTTLEACRARIDEDNVGGRLIAVIEARSNTMKMGYHQNNLPSTLNSADQVFWYKNDSASLDLDKIGQETSAEFIIFSGIEQGVESIRSVLLPGDTVVIMSNGGFEGLHQRLIDRLGQNKESG